jgi:uncharacterized protein YqjF (DUF2071 family)
MGEEEVPYERPPSDLSAEIGSSFYYQQRHEDFLSRHPALRPPGYYLKYGLKYFRRFQALRARLSEDGRAWVARTALLLQRKIEDHRARDPNAFDGLERDSRRFRKFAYATHPDAYIEGGLARLPAEDILLVVHTPDAADLLSHDGVAQIVITALDVVLKNGPTRNAELVWDAVRALSKQLGRDTLHTLDAAVQDVARESSLLEELVVTSERRALKATVRLAKEVGRRLPRLPALPWVMGQSWRNLGFCSWRLPAEEVRGAVPEELALDLHEGSAWVSLVPLSMANVRLLEPRGPALPAFPEVNLRTYVRRGNDRGVYFLSLDCGQAMVDLAAGLLFALPYLPALVELTEDQGWFQCTSERLRPIATRPEARLLCRYCPTGEAAPVQRGSLNEFLVERYSLFTVNARTRVVHRGDIAHEPWLVAPGTIEIAENTVPTAAGLPIARPPDHFGFSPGVDTRTFPFVRVP